MTQQLWFHDTYLNEYLMSFLDVMTTIRLSQTSRIYHRFICKTLLYIDLMKCVNSENDTLKRQHLDYHTKLNIESTCNYKSIELLQWFEVFYPYILCIRGNISLFKWFENSYPYILYNKDCALYHSAKSGNLLIVKYLVDIGADIHAYRDSALQWSARKGHLEVVQQLFLQSKNNCSTRRQYLLCKY
jgi:hypothetical protein